MTVTEDRPTSVLGTRMLRREDPALLTGEARYTNDLNQKLATQLAARGMIVNTADTAGFRAPLAPFYKRWKERLGSKAWNLLEAKVGKLG